MILITINYAPGLEAIRNPGADAAIRRAHAMLSIWAANLDIRKKINRLEEEMDRQGILTIGDPALNRSI